MADMNKTLRDRLLNMQDPDGIGGRILRQSLLESEGRLSTRKRIENGLIALLGTMLLLIFLHSLQRHRSTWWYREMNNILTICEVAGIALTAMLTGVTAWQALKGRCDDRWQPPLKAAGLVGSLFMLVVMGFWRLVVPLTVQRTEQHDPSADVWLGVVVVVFSLASMLLVSLGATVAVYWRMCHENAMMREKMVETQCMIAELQEQLKEKKQG
jgi:hypothetical protein